MIHALEYFLDPLTTDETYDGVVADISESGLYLLTTKPLNKGQVITIKNNISASSQAATVRWSERYMDLYYKVGLEFV